MNFKDRLAVQGLINLVGLTIDAPRPRGGFSYTHPATGFAFEIVHDESDSDDEEGSLVFNPLDFGSAETVRPCIMNKADDSGLLFCQTSKTLARASTCYWHSNTSSMTEPNVQKITFMTDLFWLFMAWSVDLQPLVYHIPDMRAGCVDLGYHKFVLNYSHPWYSSPWYRQKSMYTTETLLCLAASTQLPQVWD